MRSFRRGYTLVEVLIVVTVMGIAGALVIPSMGGAGVLRVQAAVRAVVSDIAFAQSDSLAFQTGRAVLFPENTNGYSLVEVRGSNIDASTDLMYSNGFQNAQYGDARIVSVNLAGSDGRTLIFDELGSPVTAAGGSTPASNGTIVIEGSGQRYTLTIEGYTGRVSVVRTEILPESGGGGGGGEIVTSEGGESND